MPPKYTSEDFLKPDFWRLRGKLDVPKERFVSYPGCERPGDPTLVVAWAGWDHLQQATALAAYFVRLKDEGVPAERLVPLLAGIDELVFWLKLWHNAFDPSSGHGHGRLLRRLRPRPRPWRWGILWIRSAPGSRRRRRRASGGRRRVIMKTITIEMPETVRARLRGDARGVRPTSFAWRRRSMVPRGSDLAGEGRRDRGHEPWELIEALGRAQVDVMPRRSSGRPRRVRSREPSETA